LKKIYADIVLNIPIDKSFQYFVPEKLRALIEVGKRVIVPFGRQKEQEGICIGFSSRARVAKAKLKDIRAVIDEEPLAAGEMLELSRWVADYYFASQGEALFAMIPAAVRKKAESRKISYVRLPLNPDECISAIEETGKKRPRQAELLRFLLEINRDLSLGELQELAGFSPPLVKALSKKGFISVEKKAPEEAARNEFVKIEPPELTSFQADALEKIRAGLDHFNVTMLFGITASGKTEVYLGAIEEVVASGRQAIFLVPEISLTPQTILSFSRRFRRLAVLHSALSDVERHHQWRRIKEGRADVVIGARSAVFAPVPDLGLIVIDEEHENTFKQENVPRYHARDVAVMRARKKNAPVILGSATSSLERFHNAQSGKYSSIRLKERIGELELPPVVVVDMREELAVRPGTIFSRRLEYEVRRSLQKNEQVILFLNRRGFAFYVSCKRCGYVFRCPQCDVSLTYHKRRNALVCHYCARARPALEKCPECIEGKINYRGTGTEKIEESILELFPEAKVARMDTDVTTSKGYHERVFKEFKENKLDILVGTQMIAKGLDFPNVTTVGVISADVSLNLPDFRAAERTFQLLTQVSGRTGRGAKGGIVVVQTFKPEDFSITCAAGHDFPTFAKRELEKRKELGYPPFGRLARVVFSGTALQKVKDASADLREALRKYQTDERFQLLGPAECPLAQIKGRHRWHIVLKARRPKEMHAALRKALGGFKAPASVQVSIDIDPLSML